MRSIQQPKEVEVQADDEQVGTKFCDIFLLNDWLAPYWVFENRSPFRGVLQ